MTRGKRLGIRRITGERLRRAVTAGARRVVAQADYLDQINVFPVADFDTGKNLAATMGTILHVPQRPPWQLVGDAARELATAALRGARGNSGVIFAQFFHGLAEGLAGARFADARLFSEALARAATRSRQTVAEPKEGTILTAIAAFSSRVEELARDTEDFILLMQKGLGAAELALVETRATLPVLRDAGVVDAGALGFVRFVEGIVHYIATGRMEEVSLVGVNPPLDRPNVSYDPESIAFRYCTECVVEGYGMESEAVGRVLASLGDSVVVAGSPEVLHLHVHTNTPARVRELAAAFGTVAEEKVDDMWIQHAAVAEPAKAGPALVVDTSCDLPEFLMTRHRIAVVPVRVRVGTDEFRDRTELTVRGFYERVQSGAETSTSQPPPADFLDAFVHLGRRFSSILALVLAKDLSGTWNSACQAAREAAGTGCEIEVVDSGTLSGGLGLVAWAVARGMDAGLRLREAVQLAREAAKRVVFWAALPDLRSLARSGRAPWAV
ncbi:MAG TPA: DegV family EDD domain-containing protein, partial [Candidatus Acetothermia bacterium]|nr:DegV family EDD domain-containing protein [Candidatus Acetothermia bacterium]